MMEKKFENYFEEKIDLVIDLINKRNSFSEVIEKLKNVFTEVYEKGKKDGEKFYFEQQQEKLEEIRLESLEKGLERSLDKRGYLSDEEIDNLLKSKVDNKMIEFLKNLKSYNPTTQQQIEELFNNFKEFLKEKNKRYGDSALKPLNIFSKSDSSSQICNRLDDKLSRIKNSLELKKNDLSDVFGYVALLLIQNGWTDFDDLLD